MKNVVTIALLFFVAVSVAYLVLGEMRSGARPADATTKAANNTPSLAGQPPGTPALSEADKRAPLLQAYYFHVTSRCTTCLTIERYAKEAINRGLDMPLEQALRYETDLTVILQTTRDRNEGVRAFLEKRPPRFEGR